MTDKMTPEKQVQMEKECEELCTLLDSLFNRLSKYEGAIRFATSNKMDISTFTFALTAASMTSSITPSPEHLASVERVRQIFSNMLQEIAPPSSL